VKPPPFAYADPATVPEVLAILAEQGEDGKILAGGQSLVPLLNMRLAAPRTLIDLNRIPDLSFIELRTRDGRTGLAAGAMTRQQTIEHDPTLPASLPLLQEAIAWVGHAQIRNRGTIGGSIAHADPSAELPLVFRALDGIATVRSHRGDRAIAAADFFAHAFTPSLEPHELLAEVWLPLPGPNTGQAFLEVARRHGDFALVAVIASVTLEGGVLTDTRIAIGGAAPVPLRAARAEAAVNGEHPHPALFQEAGRIAAGETEPTGDIHADAAYRREVAGTLVTRALVLAAERAHDQ
jgi:CO/xanthine dehydrogenase FAD-binding subunit